MSKLEIEGVVLVVGGSGYLGLHLLHYLATSTKFRLAYTFNKNDAPRSHPSLQDVQGFHVDLRTGVGWDQISKTLGPPAAVVNCAAISVPRECEENPEQASEVNVPRSLIQWLKSFAHNKPLLVHLSTDQVYEGTKSFYKEDEETKPVNVYGKSKVEAEKHIRAHWQNFAVLRSSIIYGPQPVVPVQKSLPVQWMDTTLAAGKKVDFFTDEFRCPVFVRDVVKVVLLLIANLTAEGGFAQLVLNVGGPDRLSRAEMAEVVAEVKGYEASLINHVKASTVDRGVKSPPDISMDVSRLETFFGITMTKFADGVRQTLSLPHPA
ncbi:hypothetical protein MPTK1_1g02650 [Marchantia polymorpha subsp. ruderalis]|uniref:RmlD-like substrate binding domain-containing protein n=2 Tax=Marchantia polymorpha TaxID=3197 RepID=A0AAF6AKS9_MARPO|nr:hypothetical protein MARPO_0113s0013 [Marchantia polymorpha]BBM97049.1 hypothetical protein Mp_1g02650 [Marchantia polymorpha subsp. ruderalis]|eukprot:PTQ31271.1 hypothetical protein MARPO_0113s0013 [Marchantia polymorpha]